MTIKKLLFVTLLSAFSFSCSSDDDSSGAENKNAINGDIVSVELRDETLTGFSNGKVSGTQKWWGVQEVGYEIYNCGEDDDEFITSDTYDIAFTTDGEFLRRYTSSGSPENVGSWNWTNSEKTQINLDLDSESGVFLITWLDENNVSYIRSETHSSCVLEEWFHNNNPYFD